MDDQRSFPIPPERARIPRALLLILFIVAICLRAIGFMVRHEYNPPPIVGAEAGVIAQHIVNGQGFASPYDYSAHPSPSTHLSPIYPYMLAAFMKMGLSSWGVYYAAVLINLFFAGLLPVVTLLLADAAGASLPVSLLAGVLMCFCPEAFRTVGLVWDEAIFVTVSTAFLWWMLRRFSAGPQKRDAAWMGAVSGLLALLNPVMVLALPAAWMAGLWSLRVRWRTVLFHGAIFTAMTLVGSAPWNIRNWFLLQPPAYVFIRGPFWLATWSSMHPIQRTVRSDGSIEYQPLHPWNHTEEMEKIDADGTVHPLTEQEYFAYCKQRVLAEFRAHPNELFDHVATQIDAFWLGMAEARRWYKSQLMFFIAQGIPAIAGVLGLILARKRMAAGAFAAFLAMLAVFPLPYYLADASMRYRHPIDPILYLGIAWLLCTAGGAWKSRLASADS